MSCSMRWRRARTMTSRYASSASSNVAGWSALIRSTTVGSSTVGSISRAAATRAALCSRELLPADLEDVVGVEPVEGAQADELVVALAPERPVVDALGAASRGATRRTRRRRPWRRAAARSSRRWSRVRLDAAAGRDDLVEQARAGSRRTRARGSATAGPAGRRPASGSGRGTPATASRRPAIEARRSGSGAKSRANSRNSPSPIASIAVERRSQVRTTSASNSDAAQVVGLELALEGRLGRQAGRVERLDRPRGGRARRRAPGAPGRAMPSPRRPSSVWMPR